MVTILPLRYYAASSFSKVYGNIYGFSLDPSSPKDHPHLQRRASKSFCSS